MQGFIFIPVLPFLNIEGPEGLIDNQTGKSFHSYYFIADIHAQAPDPENCTMIVNDTKGYVNQTFEMGAKTQFQNTFLIPTLLTY